MKFKKYILKKNPNRHDSIETRTQKVTSRASMAKLAAKFFFNLPRERFTKNMVLSMTSFVKIEENKIILKLRKWLMKLFTYKNYESLSSYLINFLTRRQNSSLSLKVLLFG